ncbi:unnamed protein product [Arctogadus glacialis]
MCHRTGYDGYIWIRTSPLSISVRSRDPLSGSDPPWCNKGGQFSESDLHQRGQPSSKVHLDQAENDLGTTTSSPFSIDVTYGPKRTFVRPSPPGEIREGGSVTLSCGSDANPAADYTWFREHGGSVEELRENYTISNITTEHGGNYYCEARNAVGLQNSTLMFLNVTATPSSLPTTVAAGTVAVLLATIFFLIFLWMRRKRASRKARGQGGRPDTRQESPPCPVYDNVSALTNRSAAQREPIEEQDDPHYASIHISRSKNQEVPRGFAGALVESDHTEQVLYSAINLKRPKAVPE